MTYQLKGILLLVTFNKTQGMTLEKSTFYLEKKLVILTNPEIVEQFNNIQYSLLNNLFFGVLPQLIIKMKTTICLLVDCNIYYAKILLT